LVSRENAVPNSTDNRYKYEKNFFPIIKKSLVAPRIASTLACIN